MTTLRAWTKAVISADLSVTERLVAVTLAGYADSQMENADPGRQRLADDIGISVATVKRSLKSLTTTGWIEKTHEGRISRDREQCDAYRLQMRVEATS